MASSDVAPGHYRVFVDGVPTPRQPGTGQRGGGRAGDLRARTGALLIKDRKLRPLGSVRDAQGHPIPLADQATLYACPRPTRSRNTRWAAVNRAPGPSR